jgi:DNA anti-recombination protein RmuC
MKDIIKEMFKVSEQELRSEQVQEEMADLETRIKKVEGELEKLIKQIHETGEKPEMRTQIMVGRLHRALKVLKDDLQSKRELL